MATRAEYRQAREQVAPLLTATHRAGLVQGMRDTFRRRIVNQLMLDPKSSPVAMAVGVAEAMMLDTSMHISDATNAKPELADNAGNVMVMVEVTLSDELESLFGVGVGDLYAFDDDTADNLPAVPDEGELATRLLDNLSEHIGRSDVALAVMAGIIRSAGPAVFSEMAKLIQERGL